MAKVISWVVNKTKYAYLGSGTTFEPTVSEEPLSQYEIKKLGDYWKNNNNQADYTNAYRKLYNHPEVNGNLTNLVTPEECIKYYYNVFAEEGVVIISGKDGKDNTEPVNDYFNLHILNQNLSVGLGGDYCLDKNTSVETEIYIEKDGTNKNSAITRIDVYDVTGDAIVPSAETVFTDETVTINFNISSGTTFDNETHSRKYKIVVSCKSVSASTYFNVTGVVNGEEGEIYNLIISPRIIKKTDSGYSTEYVNVTSTNGSAKIKYVSGETEYDYTGQIDAGQVYSGNNHTMEFRLYLSDKLIDSDSCVVIEDGKNASEIPWAELDNEMDGISLGNDNVLDKETVIGSGARLIFGSFPQYISSLAISGNPYFTDYCEASVNGADWYGFESGYTNIEVDYLQKIDFKIKVASGTSLERETFYITLANENISAETTYIILGVRGGEDGLVFRLQPSVDYVYYDPNSNSGNSYSESAITCLAYNGVEEISGVNFEIGYSYNKSYESIEDAISDLNYSAGTTAIIEEGTSSVTFYLSYKQDKYTRYLLDRETVPIIIQGLNGSDRCFIELTEPIDTVGLGGDFFLDNNAEVGSGILLYSGATKLDYDNIRIDADSSLSGRSCTLKFSSIEITDTFKSALGEEGVHANFDISEYGGTIESEFTIDLSSGVSFYDSLKKYIKVTINKDSVAYTANFTIAGIVNGEDGATYKILPSVDTIVYNPNEGRYNPVVLTCEAYYNETLIENVSEKPDAEIDVPCYKLKYSFDVIKDREEEIDYHSETGILLNASETPYNIIYMYLHYYDGENWNFIDRKSVSVVLDGENGTQGKRGKSVITRNVVWEEGKKFFGGDEDEDGLYYTDVASNKAIAFVGDEDIFYYKCIRTHISSSEITLDNRSYWVPLEKDEVVITPLVITDKIDSKYIETEELVAKKVVTENNESDKRLKTQIEAGSFNMYYDGKLVAYFSVETNQNGDPYVVLKFLNQDETWYSVGGNGAVSWTDVDAQQESWQQYTIYDFNNESDLIRYYLNDPTTYSDIPFNNPSRYTIYCYNCASKTIGSQTKYWNPDIGPVTQGSAWTDERPWQHGKYFTSMSRRKEDLVYGREVEIDGSTTWVNDFTYVSFGYDVTTAINEGIVDNPPDNFSIFIVTIGENNILQLSTIFGGGINENLLSAELFTSNYQF